MEQSADKPMKCATLDCPHPGTIRRGSVNFCKLECLLAHRNSGLSTPNGDDRKRSSDHFSPPEVTHPKNKDRDLTASLNQAYQEIQLLKEQLHESKEKNTELQFKLEPALQKFNDLQTENAKLEAELQAAKLVIANSIIDKVLNVQHQTTYAEVTRQNTDGSFEKAVLSAFSERKIEISQLNELFDSRNGGPVALNLNQNQNRDFITFIYRVNGCWTKTFLQCKSPLSPLSCNYQIR